MMMEDLKALEELVQEIAQKHNIYISTCSFYGENSNLAAQHRDSEIFIDTY